MNNNKVIGISIVATFLFWLMLYSVFFAYQIVSKNQTLYKIDKAAMSYLDNVSRQKVVSVKDPQLPGIITTTLNPLGPDFHFKPYFTTNTTCLVVYQSYAVSPKGPVAITIVYFQDNQTGKRWCLPEAYEKKLRPKRNKTQ